MSPLNLTPKQLHILTRIRDLRLTRGYSPTMQELADELGVSKVTVFEHVEALIRKGALQRQRNKARSLELSDAVQLPDEQRQSRLPLVGSIAAGLPIEAVEDRQYLDLEEVFAPGTPGSRGSRGGRGGQVGSGDVFALRVRGDSMIEDQIADGDYVIVRRTDTARNGQTVVALLPEGDATLKRFYREKNGIRLQPANADYEPIRVKDCRIQGIVVGIVRRYD
jgi:repressor LexA